VGNRRSAERPVEDGEYVIVSEAAGGRCSTERHGGGDMVLSSARWWMRMIVDGRSGAEVWCRESRQDRCPGEFEESSACKLARRVSVVSVSRRCVQVLVSVRIHCR
jgi:hypothetical protein